MLGSAESLPHGAQVASDVCVVGAGAAGIALARELAGSRLRVAVVESGGMQPDPTMQALCEGRNVGLPYYPLAETRFRGFGGSTNRWGSWCRPLDALDFEDRPWIPESGWPIPYATLAPYYARAQAACGVGPLRYDGGFWAAATGHPYVLPTGPDLGCSVVQMRDRPEGRSFAHLHGAALRRASNVEVLLHATATVLVADAGGGAVERLCVRTPAGNDASAVARCFVEHLHLTPARLVLDRRRPRRGYLDRLPYGPLALRYMYHLSTARQARHRLANLMLYLEAVPTPRQRHLGRFTWETGRRAPIDGFAMCCMAEQMPSRESRVRLCDDRDPLGQPQAALDWRLAPADRASVVRTLRVMDELVATAGLGRVELHDDDATWARLTGGHHHMGTTRMHADPARGVVDSDGRVHELRNVYVAGTSVFPTSGCANPTLTAVALTLRLADHLRAILE